MRGEPLAVRVCRRVVRLYPRAFREEYGADMVELVACQCRDESPRSVLWRTLGDLAVRLPHQHMEVTMKNPPVHLVPLAFLGVSASGLALGIVVGKGPLVGVCLALFVLGLAGTAATMRVASVARDRVEPGHGWWQLLLAGPALVGLVILCAGLGVDAWFFGLMCVLLAIALSAMGLGLAVLRLATRRRYGPRALSA